MTECPCCGDDEEYDALKRVCEACGHYDEFLAKRRLARRLRGGSRVYER